MRRQLLRRWLWELKSGPYPPGFGAVDEVMHFLKKNRRGANLRTVERIHLVHCKSSVLAFGPAVGEEERRQVAQRYTPAPRKRKKKSPAPQGDAP